MEKVINLEEWEKVGEGGQGTVYKNRADSSLMLKLGKTTKRDIMEKEYNLSKYALEIGIPTPEVYDFVTDGTHFGYTGKFIKGKKSLCRIIADNPERLEEMAHLFTGHARRLHSLKADTSRLESKKQNSIDVISKVKYLKPETLDSIIRMYSSIPETDTCLHGDLHFGNLITTGEKEYWIDLGRLRYGNPINDISQFHFVYTYLPIVCKPIFHVSAAVAKQFNNAFVQEYYGLDNEENRKEYEQLLHNSELAHLTGIIKNGLLAFWFIPHLQRHLGLKPYSRLKIAFMLMRGEKQIF